MLKGWCELKEKPILFSGPMVRAILEGRKTQTRRIVKPQPFEKDWLIKTAHTGQDVGLHCQNGQWRMTGAVGVCRDVMGQDWPKNHQWKCPYGLVGDRLWVRESWASVIVGNQIDYLYRADHHKGLEKKDGDQKWKPSIHMPRVASRLLLEVTGVRAERLQDIHEADSQAEGVDWPAPFSGVNGKVYPTCIDAYEVLWKAINGPESWAANPYVWVIEFRRL